MLLVSDGRVATFDGDLEEYRKLVLGERTTSGENTGRRSKAAGAGRTAARRAAAEKRIELAPLRRRIAEAEAAIGRLNAEITRIDTTLAEPGLFDRDSTKAAALAKARAEMAAALAKAEEAWLEASAPRN